MRRLEGGEPTPLYDRDGISRRERTQNRREGGLASAVLGVTKARRASEIFAPTLTESKSPMFRSS
jgi:hypothetical protein